jgi:hypothetical protein
MVKAKVTVSFIVRQSGNPVQPTKICFDLSLALRPSVRPKTNLFSASPNFELRLGEYWLGRERERQKERERRGKEWRGTNGAFELDYFISRNIASKRDSDLR